MGASRILHNLRRRRAESITVEYRISQVLDVDTGSAHLLFFTEPVKAVCLLPTSQRVFDLVKGTMITQGGIVDSETMQFLIGSSELKCGMTLTRDGRIRRGTDYYTDLDVVQWQSNWIVTGQRMRVETEFQEDVMTVGPQFSHGESAGEVIAVNHLVFQDGSDLYLATADNTERPAVGVVTSISGSTIYHSRSVILDDATVTGSPTTGREVYLSTDGAMTFTVPVTSGNLYQQVGFATTQNADSTWNVTIDLDTNITEV